MINDKADCLGDDITVFEPPTDRTWIGDLAERRLAQITATLNLDPDGFAFSSAEARRALDGGHDQILSDQHRQITAALGVFADTQLRARAVELFVALAGGAVHSPSSD